MMCGLLRTLCMVQLVLWSICKGAFISPIAYTLTDVESVNGSSANGGCPQECEGVASGVRRCDCRQSTIGEEAIYTGVLIDGMVPTIDTNMRRTWAAELYTVETMADYTIGFRLQSSVMLHEVELYVFYCPAWGIGAATISVYNGIAFPIFIRIGASAESVGSVTLTSDMQNCEDLTRVSIPLQMATSTSSYFIEFINPISPQQLYIAEVRFSDQPIPPPTEPATSPPTTTEPITSQESSHTEETSNGSLLSSAFTSVYPTNERSMFTTFLLLPTTINPTPNSSSSSTTTTTTATTTMTTRTTTMTTTKTGDQATSFFLAIPATFATTTLISTLSLLPTSITVPTIITTSTTPSTSSLPPTTITVPTIITTSTTPSTSPPTTITVITTSTTPSTSSLPPSTNQPLSLSIIITLVGVILFLLICLSLGGVAFFIILCFKRAENRKGYIDMEKCRNVSLKEFSRREESPSDHHLNDLTVHSTEDPEGNYDDVDQWLTTTAPSLTTEGIDQSEEEECHYSSIEEAVRRTPPLSMTAIVHDNETVDIYDDTDVENMLYDMPDLIAKSSSSVCCGPDDTQDAVYSEPDAMAIKIEPTHIYDVESSSDCDSGRPDAKYLTPEEDDDNAVHVGPGYQNGPGASKDVDLHHRDGPEAKLGIYSEAAEVEAEEEVNVYDDLDAKKAELLPSEGRKEWWMELEYTVMDGEGQQGENGQEYSYASAYAEASSIQQLEPKNIRKIKTLGFGKFGIVILADTVDLSPKDLGLSDTDDNKNNSTRVALKTLKRNPTASMKEAFEKELKSMSRLRHPNIVQTLGACTTTDSPFIVMEYMKKGDLNQYLQQFQGITQGNSPPENLTISAGILKNMSAQVASAMKYLASRNFIHRDLATRNCLVGPDLEVKIADFGMSRNLYDSHYYVVKGHSVLPVRWMARECFYGKFSAKSDVWSFGVTMWEMFTLTKDIPYEDMDDEEIVSDAYKEGPRKLLDRPEDCPQEVYDIMLMCWAEDAKDRATFEQLYQTLCSLKF